jgi:hypothetical protein
MYSLPRASGAGQSLRTPITVNGKRIVGVVVGSEFQKTLKQNHLLQKPPAIAFDVSTLDAAEEAGATDVRITLHEAPDVFTASIAIIRQYGFTFNRGYGDQVALTLNRWSRNGQPPQAERKAEQAPVKTEAASMMQPSLFGGAL